MDRLRVLTLNIWNRQGPWEERRELIRREIESLSPDVIGLQEVLRHENVAEDQAQEIARGLGYYAAYASAWQIGPGLHFGNAVLSRFPIAHADSYPLPVDAEESRTLLYAALDAPFGRLPVFVTHLTWQLHLGWVREKQVQAIAARVRELVPTGTTYPPLVMGDFNAEPDADEIRWLRGYTSRLGPNVYFCDCFAAAGEGKGYTFSRDNSYALTAAEPNRRIDYIFVRGPDRERRGEPLVARVVATLPDRDVFPSDHYGVYAELRV